MQVIVTGDFYQLPPVKAFQTCLECGVELRVREICAACETTQGLGGPRSRVRTIPAPASARGAGRTIPRSSVPSAT